MVSRAMLPKYKPAMSESRESHFTMQNPKPHYLEVLIQNSGERSRGGLGNMSTHTHICVILFIIYLKFFILKNFKPREK